MAVLPLYLIKNILLLHNALCLRQISTEYFFCRRYRLVVVGNAALCVPYEGSSNFLQAIYFFTKNECVQREVTFSDEPLKGIGKNDEEQVFFAKTKLLLRFWFPRRRTSVRRVAKKACKIKLVLFGLRFFYIPFFD